MLVCVLVEGILVYKLFHECCGAICLRVIVCHEAASLGEVRIPSCTVVRSTKPREFAFICSAVHLSSVFLLLEVVKVMLKNSVNNSVYSPTTSCVFLSHAPPVLLHGGSDTPPYLHRSPAPLFSIVPAAVLRPSSADLLLNSKVRCQHIHP